jgi:hypothetical protein
VNNAVFWDVTFLRGVRRLLVTDNVVPSSPILITLMMDALRSYETSLLTISIWCNISEDGILHSHRREHLGSYVMVVCLQTRFHIMHLST